MLVSIVAAVADNGVIGFENKIPWTQRADMKRFRDITTGHCVLVGHATYNGFTKPLPNRVNIVISRNQQLSVEGALTANSLEQALELAKQRGEIEAMVIGGTQIYQLALQKDIVDKMYLTHIHGQPDGDAFFPDYEENDWAVSGIESHDADDKNQYPYDFVDFKRLRSGT